MPEGFIVGGKIWVVGEAGFMPGTSHKRIIAVMEFITKGLTPTPAASIRKG